MNSPNYDWADGLDLPDLESRNNHWPFSVSQISVHLTRKFPIPSHDDTLLVKLHRLTKKGWEELNPSMQIIVIYRIAELFRARRQGGDARSDASRSLFPEQAGGAW